MDRGILLALLMGVFFPRPGQAEGQNSNFCEVDVRQHGNNTVYIVVSPLFGPREEKNCMKWVVVGEKTLNDTFVRTKLKDGGSSCSDRIKSPCRGKAKLDLDNCTLTYENRKGEGEGWMHFTCISKYNDSATTALTTTTAAEPTTYINVVATNTNKSAIKDASLGRIDQNGYWIMVIAATVVLAVIGGGLILLGIIRKRAGKTAWRKQSKEAKSEETQEDRLSVRNAAYVSLELAGEISFNCAASNFPSRMDYQMASDLQHQNGTGGTAVNHAMTPDLTPKTITAASTSEIASLAAPVPNQNYEHMDGKVDTQSRSTKEEEDHPYQVIPVGIPMQTTGARVIYESIREPGSAPRNDADAGYEMVPNPLYKM